ncbi:MAG: hypothetical protein M1829_006117 [Trizodia sp. TS-e1964]|nr:MAG: hypothetical protein M1829_006117 [Trizodia sp. TS-e1964]
MTTSVSPTAVPSRRPFASLDSPRLQSLANSKNRQNATPHSAMKRRYAPSTPTFEDNDTENIDPAAFGSPTKRSKTMEGFPLSTPLKPNTSASSHFVLTESPHTYEAPKDPLMMAAAVTFARPIAAATRVNTKRAIQHNASQQKSPKLNSTPAGRSPKSKRFGILNRRRTSSPFMRIDPPASHSGTPISIDAALSGTISSYAARAQAVYTPKSHLVDLNDSVKTSKHWYFQIYEDTEQDTLTNLMEHSTCTLDISDAESRRAERDARGKENIPPAPDNLMGNGVESTSLLPHQPSKQLRQSIPDNQMDIERSPLGDLKPSDYYTEDITEGFDINCAVSATDVDNSLSTKPHSETSSIVSIIGASTPNLPMSPDDSFVNAIDSSLNIVHTPINDVSISVGADENISENEDKPQYAETDKAKAQAGVNVQSAEMESDTLIL